MENWKIIKEFPNYQISDLGNVRNKYNKILNIRLSSYGYNRVRLYNETGAKNKSVHRLVAENFIPNPENKPQINHKDGNKLNNSINNLEWNTAQENVKHRFDKLYSGIEIILIKDNIEYNFKSLGEASRYIQSDISSLSKLNNGKLKTIKGYKKGGK